MGIDATAVYMLVIGLNVGLLIGYAVGDYTATRYWIKWIDVLEEILREACRRLRELEKGS